jgi:hypothetical protein
MIVPAIAVTGGVVAICMASRGRVIPDRLAGINEF